MTTPSDAPPRSCARRSWSAGAQTRCAQSWKRLPQPRRRIRRTRRRRSRSWARWAPRPPPRRPAWTPRFWRRRRRRLWCVVAYTAARQHRPPRPCSLTAPTPQLAQREREAEQLRATAAETQTSLKEFQQENRRVGATLQQASSRTAQLEAELAKAEKEKEELSAMVSELMALSESKLA
jgi:hypothetical protein